jgi:hypothetical protein
LDPAGDFILDHPVFERNFDVRYRAARDIPPSLDLERVELRQDRNGHHFRIFTGGTDVPRLFEAQGRSVRFGVFVDRDANGNGDILLTTDEAGRGVALTPDLERADLRLAVALEPDGLTMTVPSDELGNNFDWIAFSGYSPTAQAHYRTPIQGVYVVPVVDIAYAYPDVVLLFSTTLSGTGQQCQVVTTQYNSCPAMGNPEEEPVPGTNHQGVFIYGKQCGSRGYDLWCIQGSFFGKRVYKGSTQGWVARCPFKCGYNEQQEQDTDNDGVFDVITHTVTDKDCGTYHDQDNDGYLDVMIHEYTFSTNKVVSCNVEREYQTGIEADKRCQAPTAPYADPTNVPGSI